MPIIGGFSQALKRLHLEHDLTAALTQVLRSLGFEAFNYGAGRVSEQRGVLVDRIWSTLSPQWIQTYAEKGYFREDRLVAAAFQRIAPFTFDEIFSEPAVNLRQLEMEQRFGYRSGVIVPMHGPDRSFGILSAAADGPQGEVRAFSAETIANTQFVAVAFHERVRALDLPKAPAALDLPPPSLTERQLQCLAWCAVGKTNWEIGRLLGISERTAKKYLEGAMHKLHAKTRGQAASLAIELGLIKP